MISSKHFSNVFESCPNSDVADESTTGSNPVGPVPVAFKSTGVDVLFDVGVGAFVVLLLDG